MPPGRLLAPWRQRLPCSRVSSVCQKACKNHFNWSSSFPYIIKIWLRFKGGRFKGAYVRFVSWAHIERILSASWACFKRPSCIITCLLWAVLFASLPNTCTVFRSCNHRSQFKIQEASFVFTFEGSNTRNFMLNLNVRFLFFGVGWARVERELSASWVFSKLVPGIFDWL